MLLRSRGNRFLGLRPIFFVLLLLGILYFAYQKVIDHFLSNANEALVEGKLPEAEKLFRRVDMMPFDGERGQDGLGTLNLIQGDLEGARQHYKNVLERKPSSMGTDPVKILNYLLAKGTSQQTTTYTDFLKNWRSEKELAKLSLEFAEVALRACDLEGLTKALDMATRDQLKDPRFVELQKKKDAIARTGQIPILFDRHGVALMNYAIANKEFKFLANTLFEGWVGPGLDHLAGLDFYNRIQTTLDLNLQKAAQQAMRNYQGTMILTNPKTGEILAAFGSADHNPFATAFEPGSVIKVMTYGLFLESGGNTSAYAPKKYPGNQVIGDKLFYDWTEQGQLNSIDEGMAVSCNLMFAQMGIDLGLVRWLNGAKKFFDGQPKQGYLGEARNGGLLKEPEGVYDLGRAAIGLDHLQITSLGLVQIPMAVANKGDLKQPYLIQSYGPVEPTTHSVTAPPSLGHVFSEHVAEALASSLVKSVTFDRGTARRAAVDYVSTGMKTGTSGEKPFNSVMIGMFPLENPKISFALFLDKGGKCEINGALVAHRLLEQIHVLAPEYLE